MRTKTISLDIFGDHPPWVGYDWSCGDNSAAIHAIQKALLAAIDAELTDSQRRVIYGSYFEGKTITAIAAEMGVNKSTVSRYRQRALERLRHCLKYCIIMVNLLGVEE